MMDRNRHRGRKGLNLRALLSLGLCGVMGGWLSILSQPALAADIHEEIFTPYLIASLIPPTQGLFSDPRTDPGPLAYAGPSLRSVDPVLVRMGVRLIKRGEYGQAIALLEPYKFQDDFLTLHALGVAYVRTDRNIEAYNILLRAHRLNPTIAGPVLPAALACARMARSCDEYRRLALEYIALGGKFKKFADKIANHQPFTLLFTKRS